VREPGAERPTPRVCATTAPQNHDKLFLQRMLGVPESGMIPGSDQRWIDNHAHGSTGGQVVARDCRFGGEGGGFTVVLNFASFLCAPAHRSRWLHHPGPPPNYYKDSQPPPGTGPLPAGTHAGTSGIIVLDSCMIASDGDHSVAPGRDASIYLEALPAQLIVRNSWGFAFAPRFVRENASAGMAVVRVSPSLNLDGPQLARAAASPGLLRFDIDTADNSFIPDGGGGVADPGLPQQLLPFAPAAGRVHGHAPTRGVWRRHQIVWAKPNSSAPAAVGWYCTKSGTPGSWAPIGTHGTAATAAAATGAAQLLTDSLERLAQLRRAGELSEPEYSAAKAAVLGL
jgi:hypothetical protein